MFGWMLNIVYAGLLLAVSPWLLYCARTKAKYREGWGAKLLGRAPTVSPLPGEQVVWFHAVSVGEVKQLDVLFREIERRRLPWRCVVSTTTKSGYDLARRSYLDKTVFYCPLDFTWAVARALRHIQPDMLVLAELELWPNLIRAASGQGAAVAIVNGRLSERSFRGYH
ncbi:MAG: glycosyltransferase N-terminal domain-containing protein, partial [Pirellulales bacterium]